MQKTQILALAVALVLLAGMWLYVDRVLIEHQKAEAAAMGNPRGNLSDLYPSWLASRELLLHRRDPYSPEIKREIQEGYYGRALDPARKADPKNQQAFAYPVYVAFLLAPTAKLPFSEVQVLIRWFLALVTAVSVLLWIRIVRLRTSSTAELIILILTFATFPVVQGIKLQQLSLLVAALVAGSIFCLLKDWQLLAGVFLALATIKPHLVAPLILWLLLWTASRFSARWKFAASLLVSIAVLTGAGQLLLPAWPDEFFGALRSYIGYNGTHSLLDELLTRAVAVPIEVGLVIAVVLSCWKARRGSAGSEEFCWTTSLTLAVTVMLIPMIAPYNQVLLIPAALLVLRTWNREQPVNAVVRAFRGAAAACIVWSWISALALTVVSLFTTRVQILWPVPLWTSILMPALLGICLLMLCYFPPALAVSRVPSTINN